MATIDITISTGSTSLARIRDGFALGQGYQEIINGSSNPETKTQFLERKIKEFIKQSVKAGEVNSAVDTARGTASNDADQITLT